jgi:DNA-binding FrmR family transcriptional regulator
MMDETGRKQVVRRLQSIEGHIRGIQRMVEEDAYCIDTMKQINAVQAALTKVNQIILEGHLNTCVMSAVRGDDPQERERVLHEIVDVFEMSTKM